MSKKILFINDAIFGGGAELAMRTLIEELSRNNNYNLYLIVLDCDEPHNCREWCARHCVELLYVGNKKNGILIKLLSFIKVAAVIIKNKTIRFDTYLSFQNRSNYLAIIIGNILRIPKIIISERINSVDFFKQGHVSRVHKFLIRKLYNHSTYVTANSFETTEGLKEIFKINTSKIQYIPNGYNFEYVKRLGLSELRERSPSKTSDHLGKTKLVSVGRLERQKGYLRLISALKRYADVTSQPYECTIIGEGSQRSLIEEKIIETKQQEHILLLGHLDNPLPFVNKADIFLFSSYVEGFPNALAEAVILNKRIVTFNFSGGLETVLKDYPNCVIASTEKEFISGIELMQSHDVVPFTPAYSIELNAQKYQALIES